MSYRFIDSVWAAYAPAQKPSTNLYDIHHMLLLESCLQTCMTYTICSCLESRLQTCMTYTICSCSKAVYKPVWHIPLLSVQRINSWWWTDKLFNTCAVSCQNKFVKLAHLVGFIINKFITMHGHTNVKEREMSSYDNIHFPWLSCVVNAKILRVIQTNLWPPSNTAKSVK